MVRPKLSLPGAPGAPDKKRTKVPKRGPGAASGAARTAFRPVRDDDTDTEDEDDDVLPVLQEVKGASASAGGKTPRSIRECDIPSGVVAGAKVKVVVASGKKDKDKHSTAMKKMFLKQWGEPGDSESGEGSMGKAVASDGEGSLKLAATIVKKKKKKNTAGGVRVVPTGKGRGSGKAKKNGKAAEGEEIGAASVGSGEAGVARKRRYPKLLQYDRDGVPVAAPGAYSGASVVHKEEERNLEEDSRGLGGEDEETDETLIKAGKRCGTVQYWRSSLQMPKSSGVRVPRGDKAGGRQLMERESLPGARDGNGADMNDDGDRHHQNEVPYSNGNGPALYDMPMEGRRGPATYANDDAGADRAMYMEDRASGHRDISEGAPAPWNWGQSTHRTAHDFGRRRASYEDERDMATAVHHGEPLWNAQRMSGMDNYDGVGYEPAALTRPNYNNDRQMQMQQMARSGPSAPVPHDAEQRLQRTMNRFRLVKEYELRKIEIGAATKYHVKMNLRGRSKLEQWLSCADDDVANAVVFVTHELQLDPRITSNSSKERKLALYGMCNEKLRALEALMIRITTRDGRANWNLLMATLTNRVEPHDYGY